MSTHTYGPVPLSRLGVEAADVRDALSRGERVLVSRHGDVLAELVPPARLPVSVLAMIAMGDSGLPELTSRELDRGNVARYVRDASDGQVHLLTRAGHLRAMLVPTLVGRPSSRRTRAAEARAAARADEALLDSLPEDATAARAFQALVEHQTKEASDVVDELVRLRVETATRSLLEREENAFSRLVGAVSQTSARFGAGSPELLLVENNVIVHSAYERRAIWQAETMAATLSRLRDRGSSEQVLEIVEHNYAALADEVLAEIRGYEPKVIKASAFGNPVAEVTMFRVRNELMQRHIARQRATA